MNDGDHYFYTEHARCYRCGRAWGRDVECRYTVTEQPNIGHGELVAALTAWREVPASHLSSYACWNAGGGDTPQRCPYYANAEAQLRLFEQ